MFTHIFVSVTDFKRAHRFYAALMDVLGLEQRFFDEAKPWAGWHSEGQSRPYFVICHPFDGQPHGAGNGQMVAFNAATRAAVDAAHTVALAHGGLSEGAPGLRPEYTPSYYGAYFRDPDHNKICVACHAPPRAL
jgi:lactoylglutathione lyase